MKKRILSVLSVAVFLFFVFACSNGNSFERYESYIGYQPKTLGSGDLKIHFLELGNKFTGDCVYINYGDVDIIIDAGSKQDSAATIIKYLKDNDYVKDNIIEYVIATHAHEDHIAGFTTYAFGSQNFERKGILDTYDIDLIIDFPRTNSATATYNNYRAARDRAVVKGAIHVDALDCYRNRNGGKRVYDLGEGASLEILYNYYYENYSSNENEYSVCIKISQGDKQYIFTGDLEKNGEDRLVNYYNTNHNGLGKSVLYKGGHHGSETSSHPLLMGAIKPDYVCVCSCVGTYEYPFNDVNRFPSQGFIDRVSPYTDAVYITTLIESKAAYDAGNFKSFNGNIIFMVKEGDGDISISFSNNNLKLKETTWFEDNREMPEAWK